MPTLLAVFCDAVHVLAMFAWAVGLPFLFWHRWPGLSIAYTLYALSFVIISQVSHHFLGECFLTTLSRHLWAASGQPSVGTFTVRLVNAVAGVRPSADSAVLAWEIGIAGTALGTLWSLYRSGQQWTKLRRPRPTKPHLGSGPTCTHAHLE